MFNKKKKQPSNEINAGSMADIAFLLLIFFLITTTFSVDQAVKIQLPPKEEVKAELEDRNVLRVYLNYKNQLLVEDEEMDMERLAERAKRFINNKGRDPFQSDNPQIAAVSLKTDRGTTQGAYIQVLDEVKRAYHELKAEYLKISVQEYNALNPVKPREREMIDRAEEAYPLRISIAEPTDIKK